MDTPSASEHELRKTYLFAGLDDAQLARVVQGMRVQRLEKGERVFDHGQPARRFFLLRSGQVKLFRLSAEGAEKIIEVVRPGGTFAEAVMFMEGKCYPVSAEALEAGELLSFDNNTFLELLRESVETSFRLMAGMSQRLHARLNEIDNLCLHNATFRLVAYLLQQVPAGTQEASQVLLTIPKGVIASHLSIQRETFSRILARLRAQNLVEVQGNAIILRDIPALQKMVTL
jgi:CRP/FNR family transcriptional regulator, dissimilatory nitrate respiration regulator